MSATRLGRRRLLAATATGVATAVAGCGYRPGGGEFDWRLDLGTVPPFGGSADETWHTDGTSLFRIRNRSGQVPQTDEKDIGFEDVDDAYVTAFHSTGETAWSGHTERRYVGDPAVDDGRVYLSLEDGGVTALEEPDDEGDGNGRDEDDPHPRWTADWAGPPLSLRADGNVLVGVYDDGVVGFDADDGPERFALTAESLEGEAIIDAVPADDWVWVVTSGTPVRGNDPDDAAAHVVTNDGHVRATISLSSTPDWLESVGTDSLLGVDGEVLALTPTGDRRFALALEEATASSAPVVVGDRDRLYYSHRTIEAVDVAAGEIAWRRGNYSIRDRPVADGAGIYGRESGSGRDTCELVAMTADGEQWWEAPLPDEPGCSGELFLVDDRLVVVTRGSVYGFRKAPDERLSVL